MNINSSIYENEYDYLDGSIILNRKNMTMEFYDDVYETSIEMKFDVLKEALRQFGYDIKEKDYDGLITRTK